MNHKRRRPKHQRAGCLMCKPHKDERAAMPSVQERKAPTVDDFDTIGSKLDRFCAENPGVLAEACKVPPGDYSGPSMTAVEAFQEDTEAAKTEETAK